MNALKVHCFSRYLIAYAQSWHVQNEIFLSLSCIFHLPVSTLTSEDAFFWRCLFVSSLSNQQFFLLLTFVSSKYFFAQFSFLSFTSDHFAKRLKTKTIHLIESSIKEFFLSFLFLSPKSRVWFEKLAFPWGSWCLFLHHSLKKVKFKT